MECLKKLCVQNMSLNLDLESVIDFFLLADMHLVAELKSICIQYFTMNATKVMATEGWKSLISTNRMDLMAELMKKLALSANR